MAWRMRFASQRRRRSPCTSYGKGRVGVHYAVHPHQFADADWDALLDFADQQLLGKKVTTRFDEWPEE